MDEFPENCTILIEKTDGEKLYVYSHWEAYIERSSFENGWLAYRSMRAPERKS